MKRRSGFAVMARLIVLVKPLTGYMLLAILMGFIGHLCAAFITILGGYAVLDVLGYEGTFNVKGIFICVLLFALLRAVLRYAEQGCNHFIAFKLLALIRDKVFQALRKLCPAKLEGRDKGDLISVITSDIELLEVFYAHTISPAAIAFLFTIGMTLFIGSFHPALGLLALLAYITVGIVIPIVTSRLSQRKAAGKGAAMKFRTGSGELSAFVLDSLRGLPEIIQYGQGEKRLEEMNTRTQELSQEEGRMKRISGRNGAAANTVILLFDLCMLLGSAMLCRSGSLDFSGVLIPTLALFSSFGPVIALANLGSTLQSTFAAGNRVLDILDEMPVAEEITDGVSVEGREGSFSGAGTEKLRFSYGEKAVLEDVDVVFSPGRITGIMGRSGSGKSTLLKLLMRFWKADSGKVMISGSDIENINTASLRDCESFVTQETHLFHDSIRNNLKIARPDATEEEMEAACRKASVHDFIMTLPQGYDTPVGELGDTLSGGERQRLGLARAFLHDAPFLLLDEPTSNLDSLNEAVILKSLFEEGEGRTVVLVSHRQSTMGIAHRIYTIENISRRKKDNAGRDV